METREKAKQEGMSTGSYIRRNEKKTEEKQPEKQTDGNETDQKDTETDADQSEQPDTEKPAADEKTAPDEEKAAEKPGNNETTPGTEEAKPDSQDGNQQTEKMQLPDQRKTHRRNKMGKQSSPQHKILRKTEMTKSLSKSITIITGIMIAMNIGNPIGIMKIHQTEGIRTATGTERRMPINIKIRREVPANKLHY